MIEDIKKLGDDDLLNLIIKNFKRFGVNSEYIQWHNRVERTLKRICSKESKLLFQFKQIQFLDTGYRPHSEYEVPADKITFINSMKKSIVILKIVIEEIQEGLYDNISKIQEVVPLVELDIDKTKVFIVHGHDEALKTEVELFLKNQNLEPIILHKQANMGKTIIEKLEHYGKVGYAIVLYTHCDLGKAKDDKDLKYRARQNVVFEHGYFVGLLGRDKVSFLVDADIETPGDISGIVYQAKSHYWQYDLIKELKAAGYAVSADII